VFDADILTSNFADGQPVSADYTVPRCFTHDAMGGTTGSRFRPLPPAWLLVGAARQGARFIGGSVSAFGECC
jgi:hypothetical protein